MLGVNALLDNKKGLTYSFFALAVGCRPFSAIYLIVAFLYFILKEKKQNLEVKKMIKGNLLPIIPVIIIATIYMVYNYVRFRNPFEFGHNYLPEFSTEGGIQFSFSHFPENIKSILNLGIRFDDKLHINFNQPFNFLIANPIIIVAIYHAIKNIAKTHKISLTRLIFLSGGVAIILLTLLHRTLGGWQFGARYTCDIIPMMFLSLFFTRTNENDKAIISDGEKIECISLDRFEIAVITFGIILNVFGAVIMWQH